MNSILNKQPKQFLRVEGNNGGDFIEIHDVGNGKINLKSGSCCVMSIDTIVPVEFLTAILSEKMMEYDGGIEAIIDSFGWDKKYKNELKNMVYYRRLNKNLILFTNKIYRR